MRWLAVWTALVVMGCSDDPKLLETSNNGNNGENNSNNNSNNFSNNLNNFPDINNEVDDNNSVILNNETPDGDSRNYQGTLPTRPSAEVEAFVYDMGKAYCERLVECRTDSRVLRFANARQIATVGDCVADFLTRLSPSSFQASVTSGVRSFDATSAATCLSELPGLACGSVPGGYDGPGVVLPPCREAFDGDGRALADCTSNADCLTGLFCDRAFDPGCAGACVYGYVEDVMCGADGTTLCTVDEYCDLETLACTPLPTAGQACGTEGVCAPNLFCNDDVCTASVVGFQVGQSCDRISSLCALGLFCDVGTNDVGTCKELVGAGSPCNSDVWPGGCDAESYCEAGTCVARKSAGACLSGDECLGGWCAVDACVDTAAACQP